jgi:hypothetical protein
LKCKEIYWSKNTSLKKFESVKAIKLENQGEDKKIPEYLQWQCVGWLKKLFV